MPHDHDMVPALSEVPWPDQPPHDLEVLALCCVECSNDTFVEIIITTDRGRESALECTWCQEVYINDR
ncbi:hypothetical protein [Nonomuraea jabiensis]|uniref:Uncharacterized protein n=1 Tax=Nonomuraea jabiensis TaxID=882448 RepID=A0A7W9G7N8_9ACTN|nr:hypothetical protein [Nonomuraea jabiensis]MBB5778658.1 hypothetical protein [Nonomuraea jabiensis]